MEGVEVVVVVAFLPAPHFIIVARGEAEPLGRVEVEDVEVIGATPNLNKKPVALIPNPQNALVDLHFRPALVQLAEAHVGIAERWDVVDAVKHLVLVVLRLENDGTDAMDLHLRLVTELHRAFCLAVEVS